MTNPPPDTTLMESLVEKSETGPKIEPMPLIVVYPLYSFPQHQEWFHSFVVLYQSIAVLFGGFQDEHIAYAVARHFREAVRNGR